jgi:hypothetical protein
VFYCIIYLIQKAQNPIDWLRASHVGELNYLVVLCELHSFFPGELNSEFELAHFSGRGAGRFLKIFGKRQSECEYRTIDSRYKNSEGKGLSLTHRDVVDAICAVCGAGSSTDKNVSGRR